MSFQPAASLTEQIADHLGTEIIAGRLRPRTRIQELKVASHLGVSRGSVREALLLLERRHLIEILPRRGAVVSCLGVTEIGNCSELFTALQVACYSRLARRKLDPEPLQAALTQLQTALRETAGGSQNDAGTANGQGPQRPLVGVLEARRRFLCAALAQLDDVYLGSVLNTLVPASLRIAHLAAAHPDHDPRDCLRHHRALLDALTCGNCEQVAQLLQAFNARERKLAICCAGQAPN
ncbi:MAG: GntR family transcriptional regulator [Pseudomonadales bacterium]